ncbi:MAG TPA: hypothetical protein VMB91_04855 [Solirubrobacteraceae bacterium]|nr:hypothetical protein [Solirubrobacteraceae bacterium]
MAATESGFSDNHPLVRPLDEEQSRLVEILLAAGGADVSFEELRRQGIENPAVLAYELEIAGLPIAHVQRTGPGNGPSSVGLRLDGTVAREASSVERTRETGPGSPIGELHDDDDAGSEYARFTAPRPPRAPRPGLLPVAVTVLAAFALVILLVAVLTGGGSDSGGANRGKLALRGSQPAHTTPAAGAATAGVGAAGRHHHHGSRSRAGAHASEPPPPLGPAAELQLAGHQLLAEGQYAAAIAKLRAALSAGGESASNCTRPSTPGCVTYAETLYDLGRALRLDNAPAAAGAVLRERLEIDTQQAAVRHELGLNHEHKQARAPTGHRQTPHTSSPHRTTTPPPAAKKPHPLTGGASAPAATPVSSEGHGTTGPATDSQPTAPGGSTAP